VPPYGAAGNYSESQWDRSSLSVSNGILTDKAWLDAANKWHSGNLSSIDPTGAGFSQLYGYFEIRAQMPNSGTGAWPAFWLTGKDSISNKTEKNEEVDIFEWYGTSHNNTPGLVQQASHNWNPDGTSSPGGLYSPQTKMPDGSQPWAGYHIYGCQIDPVHITWYIDGVATNQVATPTSYMTSPFYIMVDYALGGGWPLTGMVNGSSLNVDWVRVYALPTAATSPAPQPATGSIGVQFKGSGTALLPTDLAGLASVAQKNWNVLTGSSFTKSVLNDSTGAATTATLTGSANGVYWSGGSVAAPVGNQKLASGELYNNTTSTRTLTVSNIPYAKYGVYLYAGIDAAGRAETTTLTELSGTPESFSFTTEHGNSQWTAATSTWDGTGTAPVLPTANYVHFGGLTATGFTLKWGAPGNGGLNGIQIVPEP
jgi:beta-glucanase (GH16 family)